MCGNSQGKPCFITSHILCYPKISREPLVRWSFCLASGNSKALYTHHQGHCLKSLWEPCSPRHKRLSLLLSVPPQRTETLTPLVAAYANCSQITRRKPKPTWCHTFMVGLKDKEESGRIGRKLGWRRWKLPNMGKGRLRRELVKHPRGRTNSLLGLA